MKTRLLTQVADSLVDALATQLDAAKLHSVTKGQQLERVRALIAQDQVIIIRFTLHRDVCCCQFSSSPVTGGQDQACDEHFSSNFYALFLSRIT
jgi:hypothetical protein